MEGYCQTEGINTYFITTLCEEKGWGYEMEMLYNNFIPGIIQPEFRYVDGQFLSYCKINGMKDSASILTDGEMDLEKALKLFKTILNTVKELGEYMLCQNDLVLDTRAIFMSVRSSDFYLIYAPGQNEDIRNGIKRLADEMMKYINHRNHELVDLIYGVYDLTTFDNYDLNLLEEHIEKFAKSYGEKACAGSGKRCANNHSERIDNSHGDLNGSDAASSSAYDMDDSNMKLPEQSMRGNHINSQAERQQREHLMDEIFNDDASCISTSGKNRVGAEKTGVSKTGAIKAGVSKTGISKTGSMRKANIFPQYYNLIMGTVIGVTAVFGVTLFLWGVLNMNLVNYEKPLMVVLVLLAAEIFILLEFRKKYAGVENYVESDVGSGEERNIESSYVVNMQNNHSMKAENSDYEYLKVRENANVIPMRHRINPERTAGCKIALWGNKGNIYLDVGNAGIVIGRDGKKAQFVIDDKSVSRRQAVLKYNNDNLVVYDAGSTNGTYLNGRYVSREDGRHVKDGDRLMFGEVEYTVQMIEQASYCFNSCNR
jgi:hypothetical protein